MSKKPISKVLSVAIRRSQTERSSKFTFQGTLKRTPPQKITLPKIGEGEEDASE